METNSLKQCTKCCGCFEAGHFFSPIPSQIEIEGYVHDTQNFNLYGINLNDDVQLEYLKDVIKYYEHLPFDDYKKNDLRYQFINGSYTYSDAIFLFGLINKIKPNRIIEIGSGWSSCVTLDTNELFFDNKINLTFIEPYPELLISLLKKNDINKIRIVSKKLQEVPVSTFKDLTEGDILFVDSTHVSKLGSDVNQMIFNILPNLNAGVYIHFHDIYYPFEYPKEWLTEGRFWTEGYILRAFLQYNNNFEIVCWNSYLDQKYADIISKSMPLCLKNGGGSIWIRKIK